jgi:hypothetical protein
MVEDLLRGGVRWEFRTNIDFHAGSVADELDEPIPLEYLRLEPVLGSLISTAICLLIVILGDRFYP